jgi:lipooligosaccharide transport system permease protein
MSFAAAFHWQSRAVLLRHLRVYLRNWYTAFLPPATEPIVMLLAFGLGLGSHVAGIARHGSQIPYATYIAPGLIAYTAFLTPFFQSLFGAYIRMHYQKTWEGQLTTQVELPHVIWGELLWSALLATMYVTIVAIVIACCDLLGVVSIHSARLPLVLPFAFAYALAFASIGLVFTAILPSIDHMNLPVFLVALPLGFTSNTYFPVPMDHALVAVLMHANPLWHLSEGLRSLLLGGPGLWQLAAGLGECILLLALLVPIIRRKLRRRVLGER